MRKAVLIILALCLYSFTPVTIETEVYASKNAEESKERIISKRKAIKSAQSQVKGKVLSASLIKSKGPAVYRVKMLVSDKRVRTVFVDGKNGRVIRIN